MFFTTIKVAGLMVFLLTGLAFGGSLTGVLTDTQTGEPIPGAMVKLMGYDIAAVSDSDGRFTLGDLPSGEGRLVISHVGYNVAKRSVNFNREKAVSIELEPKILEGQDIIVTATRAEKGKTPAAFSNMTNKDIAQNYWAQDTPMLLSSMPNVFAYSDAGNGIGYSYLKIRGFDQKRISVMLNGIPLNDAESHEVFWVDLPDFASNVADIQVQRGIGSSLYGASSIGGSVNLVTNDFSAVPQLKVETGYGSYNTGKLSISGNSGLINDSYVFYGRYSRIETDGYRDNSWSKMFSYFIGLARYDENMTWKFNTYGGPEESHLAYKGITESQLSDNRKFNELQYDDEIDHFNQPHYELIHDWKLNEDLNLSNTIYYFHGDGHYTQQRNRKDVEEYFPDIYTIAVLDTNLAPRDYYDTDDFDYYEVDDSGYYNIDKVDLVRRRTVKEHDWGWLPRLTLNHTGGVLAFGGEMRIHSGHHYGEVLWANVYPQNFGPNIRYYDYKGKSNTFTVYALETYQLLDQLDLMVNFQYQRHNYKLEDDKRFNVIFDRDYDFFSPRAGANYSFNDNVNVFINTSMTSRHPAFKDIYDPTDYWSNPYYKSSNFNSEGANWAYAGKELNPEKLIDIELGADLKYIADEIVLNATVNLYRMQINDEIVPYAGQVDDNGYPISGNAEKTLHQGVELSFNSMIQNQLNLRGNISVNDDHFVEYREYGFDWDAWEAIEYDRADKRIGGFPSMLANYRLGYLIEDFEMGVSGRYIGKQYVDNGEQYKLDPYHIIDADISYNFGKLVGVNSLKAILRVNNMSDLEYEQTAYIEVDDGLPRYMVGADRNFYFSLSTEF